MIGHGIGVPIGRVGTSRLSVALSVFLSKSHTCMAAVIYRAKRRRVRSHGVGIPVCAVTAAGVNVFAQLAR